MRHDMLEYTDATTPSPHQPIQSAGSENVVGETHTYLMKTKGTIFVRAERK